MAKKAEKKCAQCDFQCATSIIRSCIYNAREFMQYVCVHVSMYAVLCWNFHYTMTYLICTCSVCSSGPLWDVCTPTLVFMNVRMTKPIGGCMYSRWNAAGSAGMPSTHPYRAGSQHSDLQWEILQQGDLTSLWYDAYGGQKNGYFHHQR